MKTIHVDKITEEVKRMAIEAAHHLARNMQLQKPFFYK